MKDNKVNEIFTVDKIKEIVDWIYKNLEFLQIEPLVKDNINDILNGNDINLERLTRGIIIFDESGKPFDITIILEEAWNLHEEEMLDYLESESQENEQFFREKNADKIKNAHQVVDKTCDDEGKSLEERKKRHEEIDSHFENAILEMHKIFNKQEKYRIINEVTTEKGLNKLLESIKLYMKESGMLIGKFCKMNDVSIEIQNMLLKIAYVHSYIGYSIIELFKWSLIQQTNLIEIIDCYGNWFKNKEDIGIRPQKEGFHWYLVDSENNVNKLFDDDNLKKELIKYVKLEVKKMHNLWQEIEEEQQALIDITPQQTLSIETAAANVEEGKEERTFDDLFPSIEDKEMVMKMLVALKIINLEGKYLLGSKRGIIRVFIDVMKEEGYFVDIDRKPILRVFTPVIIGKTVVTIEEPLNFSQMKRKIIDKLIELKK